VLCELEVGSGSARCLDRGEGWFCSCSGRRTCLCRSGCTHHHHHKTRWRAARLLRLQSPPLHGGEDGMACSLLHPSPVTAASPPQRGEEETVVVGVFFFCLAWIHPLQFHVPSPFSLNLTYTLSLLFQSPATTPLHRYIHTNTGSSSHRSALRQAGLAHGTKAAPPTLRLLQTEGSMKACSHLGNATKTSVPALMMRRRY
jgi:hypothetical protein